MKENSILVSFFKPTDPRPLSEITLLYRTQKSELCHYSFLLLKVVGGWVRQGFNFLSVLVSSQDEKDPILFLRADSIPTPRTGKSLGVWLGSLKI